MDSDRYYIPDEILVISYTYYRCRTKDFIFRVKDIYELPDMVFHAHHRLLTV